MPADTPENRVTQAVLLGTRHLVAWMRNNTGVATYGSSKVWYGVGGKGGSDYIGIVRSTGQFIACEMKAPGKEPTREQLHFIEDVKKAGGLGVVAYGVDDVLGVLGRSNGRTQQ
jgi:hypothetical protein